MRFPLGEMTVGDILDRGLKLLFARLPVFYAINLIVLSPYLFLQLAAPFVVDANPTDPSALVAIVGVGLLALLVLFVLQPIGTATILYVIMEEYAGRRPPLGRAFGFALSRFGPLLGVSILYGTLFAIGILLCVVPGIYVLATYAFVAQVAVLERLGVGASFERSKRLTEGFLWRVIGVLLLIGVGNVVAQTVVGWGLGAVLPPYETVPTEDGNRPQLNPVNHVVTTLTAQLVSILFATYVAVCTTLLYLDLRIRKEGFDLELAAGRDPVPGDDPTGSDRDDRPGRGDYL